MQLCYFLISVDTWIERVYFNPKPLRGDIELALEGEDYLELLLEVDYLEFDPEMCLILKSDFTFLSFWF